MKKARKIKFTLGMKIASILCCVALVSVGFASWWIVEFPQAQQFSAGSFEVYDVTTKRIAINNIKFLDDVNDTTATAVNLETPDADIEDAKIVYGKPTEAQKTAHFTGTKTDKGWLGATDVDDEDLSTILQFDVAVADNESGDKLSTYVQTITVTLDAEDIFGTINNGVAAPKMSYKIGTTASDAFGGEVTYTKETSNAPLVLDIPSSAFGDGATVTVQIKLDFGWSYTSDQSNVTINPYLHYNEQDYDGDLANELTKADNSGILDKIYALNNAKYDITISTTPGRTASN